MKKFTFITVLLIISSVLVFASELTSIGYGSSIEEAKKASSENLQAKIKTEVFKGDEEAYNSFNIDEFVATFTYSDPIITGSTKPYERFRVIANFDDREIKNYLEKNLQEKHDSVLEQQSEGVETVGQKITSYDDFLRNYDAKQEERRKAEEDMYKREASEKERSSRLFKLSWELGIDLMIPLNNNIVPKGTEYVTGGYGIQMGIGTIINNNILLMIDAVPTFATKETKKDVEQDGKITTVTEKVSMRYHKTYLDFTAAYRFKWNLSDLFLGLAVGFDADTAKEFFIMPKVRLGLNFNTFRPVFESAAVSIDARYTFSTKIWSLGVAVTFFGIY